MKTEPCLAKTPEDAARDNSNLTKEKKKKVSQKLAEVKEEAAYGETFYSPVLQPTRTLEGRPGDWNSLHKHTDNQSSLQVNK